MGEGAFCGRCPKSGPEKSSGAPFISATGRGSGCEASVKRAASDLYGAGG